MSHLTARFCARCHAELTDAASMEEGIGPICRGYDNDLLAQMIPGDVTVALNCFGRILIVELPPETLDTVMRIKDALTASAALDPSVRTQDWRATVKRIEWVLSWVSTEGTREWFCATVEALGYLTLAQLWRDPKSVTRGETKIYAEDGRLFYEGPRNKTARLATKEHGGRFIEKGREGGAGWSLPASKFDAFIKIVKLHYPKHTIVPAFVAGAPVHDATWEGLAEYAAKWKAVEVATPKGPAIKVDRRGLFLLVHSPYSSDFVNRVKAECRGRWNKEMRVWQVEAEFAPRLSAILLAVYHFSWVPDSSVRALAS